MSVCVVRITPEMERALAEIETTRLDRPSRSALVREMLAEGIERRRRETADRGGGRG